MNNASGTKPFILAACLACLLAMAAAIVGCGGQTVDILIPPETPEPHDVYTFYRDFDTVWNATLRAVEKLPEATALAALKEEGTITLARATVPVAGNADCGRLGKDPVLGDARRDVTITVSSTGLRETRVVVRAHYHIMYGWWDSNGDLVRKERIRCVSTGRFEDDLRAWISQFLGN
ncbi:MAG: hypothetical protein ACLFOY_17105 [Desulfatibacillaceae bacterium]